MASTADLAEPLRSKIDQLLAEAGGRVTVVSGLRTRAQQIELRRKHCGPTRYDIYEKPASQCSPPTARPGTSKHETGEAVDLRGDLNLAARIGRRLGLTTPVAGEPWHFELGKGIASTPVVQGITGGIVDLGGDVAEAAVAPLLEGLKKVLITGAILAGGAALIVAGGYRATTGRTITGDTAKVAGDAAVLVATKKAPGGKTA